MTESTVTEQGPSADELEAVTREFETAPASKVVKWAVDTFGDGLVLAASFEDVVLIDLATKLSPDIEVIFLDTEAHFPETLAFALNLGLATLFVVLLRESLQHGVVTPGTNAVDPNRRTLFVVGSPGGFIASAIALHVVAALLFLASAHAAGAATRVGLVFVLGMSSLVTLLGLFAYLLSATMPLDAVLDDYGVTFAGATRAWHSIQAIVEICR